LTQPANDLSSQSKKQPKTQRTKNANYFCSFKDTRQQNIEVNKQSKIFF
jgi:hypothetical protein